MFDNLCFSYACEYECHASWSEGPTPEGHQFLWVGTGPGISNSEILPVKKNDVDYSFKEPFILGSM